MAPTLRSFTGRHDLLPAAGSAPMLLVPRVSTHTFLTWTFGRGSVIWRIWPAVALHTMFAAIIVTISLETRFHLDIPGVMLTVLGVVIGFVISYRASSGYERYWMGRSCWADLMKQTRTTTRLIWLHVPPYLSGKTSEEAAAGKFNRSDEEKLRVMDEKRMCLDLLHALVVSVKHHLRGERGIYYEDIYHLVKSLHDHSHGGKTPLIDGSLPKTTSPPPTARASGSGIPETQVISPVNNEFEVNRTYQLLDPVIPSITEYGTFDPKLVKQRSRPRLRSSDSRPSISRSNSNSSSVNQPLLPSTLPTEKTIFSRIASDLIPFEAFFSAIGHWFQDTFGKGAERVLLIPEDHQQLSTEQGDPRAKQHGPKLLVDKMTHAKHRPLVAGGGKNVPVEVLRCISDWVSVLEDRGNVPGTTLGNLIAGLANFEESLTTLEKILTTPLPFVYSVHIRHTVWIYLFFLPFQLVANFGWYTVAGVCVASFMYLGFLAAGEEIEQPFGYDENDLDLDLFCEEIVRVDIETLKTTPGHNVYLEPHEQVHPRGFASIADASIRATSRKPKAGTL